MTDWIIATEGVKVIKDSVGLWPQIITAISSAGAALGGVGLSHHFTRKREEATATRKRKEEHLFITTELVFLLERFADECSQVAADSGEPDLQGEYSVSVQPPKLKMDEVTGDWRTLPVRIMYRIRELPILQNEANRFIASISEYDWAPFYNDSFKERQYQYARLGLKALILAIRLRKTAGLPSTRLDATEWSAMPQMWNVWRRERKNRAQRCRERAEGDIDIQAADQQPT
ncbi:hypothetical protein [Pectobacterium betavasculorum]|uniref:hypothetical protein n=1 Tax=Pectobacterium betavasculorum TaxID=55207 RepID=UPI00068A9B94|nr:hypothetical protein [Pectobacterium betavasculorum]